MESLSMWWIIPLVFILDFILGDPLFLPHPVRWMGLAIERAERYFRKLNLPLVLSGGLFAGSLILGTWLLVFIVVSIAFKLHPLLGVGLELVLMFYCISAGSLEKSAKQVWKKLTKNDLAGARKSVGMIVGRETGQLDENGVARAAVETVAENFVDGVLSPLFFAVIGGAPLAMAYKMVNTLDSMVGYKNERYLKFGRIAARIDDAANFLPARLSVPIIALGAKILFKTGRSAWETALAEGKNHTSPNAGYPEAAFSGALKVRLNGPNIYHGELVSKPFIGEKFPEVGLMHIKRACELMLLASLITALVGGVLVWVLRLIQA